MSLTSEISGAINGFTQSFSKLRKKGAVLLDDAGFSLRQAGNFIQDTGSRVQNSRYALSDTAFNASGGSLLPRRYPSSPSQERTDQLIGWGFVGVVGFVAWTALSKGGK